jgi:uncharacterized membrane protein (DUF4010 family)
MDRVEIFTRLGVAALAGLAVGFEREWSARGEPTDPRFGGIRTFLLLGLAGGLAVVVGSEFDRVAGMVLVGAAALLVLVGYVVTALRGHVDATTEVAGLVVVCAGVLAGSGRLAIASGVAVFAALVLAEKTRLHALVRAIDATEIRAGLHFAVLAVVVLPLLPVGPIGPGAGIRPQALWALVLLFAGLSFAGFIALRLAGPERGWGLAGLLGGIVSSTAVTIGFSRESREAGPDLGRALALGVLAACAVLPFRVLLVASLLEPRLGVAFLLPIAPCALAGVAMVVWLLRRSGPPAPATANLPGNPLRLGAAIQMTVFFQIVLYGLEWVTGRFGQTGALPTAFLLGLTDLDALTFSMTELVGRNTVSASVAARSLMLGVLANTLFKTGLVLVVGRGAFRRWAGRGMVVFVAALGLGLALVMLG